MKTRFLGTAGTVAGLLLCIGIAPNVYAQTAVLNLAGGDNAPYAVPKLQSAGYSTFTFNQSFILNSIGFVSYNKDLIDQFTYKIGDSEFLSPNVAGLTREAYAGGVTYYTFTNPQTYAAGTQVTIRSLWGPESVFRQLDGTQAAINVAGITHTTPFTGFASGNLRVTPLDPGSNVAPEPGSFALALTGGAALLGICVRRRRNAG